MEKQLLGLRVVTDGEVAGTFVVDAATGRQIVPAGGGDYQVTAVLDARSGTAAVLIAVKGVPVEPAGLDEDLEATGRGFSEDLPPGLQVGRLRQLGRAVRAAGGLDWIDPTLAHQVVRQVRARILRLQADLVEAGDGEDDACAHEPAADRGRGA